MFAIQIPTVVNLLTYLHFVIINVFDLFQESLEKS